MRKIRQYVSLTLATLASVLTSCSGPGKDHRTSSQAQSDTLPPIVTEIRESAAKTLRVKSIDDVQVRYVDDSTAIISGVAGDEGYKLQVEIGGVYVSGRLYTEVTTVMADTIYVTESQYASMTRNIEGAPAYGSAVRIIVINAVNRTSGNNLALPSGYEKLSLKP